MSENARYSRRHVVAGGAATVVGLTGCLSDGESTPEPVDVTLTNTTDERYEVNVRIELREEALLGRTFTLYASGEVETAFGNPDEPGNGMLSVAVDGVGATYRAQYRTLVGDHHYRGGWKRGDKGRCRVTTVSYSGGGI